jgi:hypothetical protein
MAADEATCLGTCACICTSNGLFVVQAGGEGFATSPFLAEASPPDPPYGRISKPPARATMRRPRLDLVRYGTRIPTLSRITVRT